MEKNKYKKLSALAMEIQAAVERVEEGRLPQSAMEGLIAQLNELHERLIVLRYKAYEKLVKEEETEEKKKPNIPPAVKEEQQSTTFEKKEEVESNGDVHLNQTSLIDAIEEMKEEVSINEKYANQVSKEKTVSEKHKSSPVADLKKAIGINQKYAWSEVLFSSDEDAFTAAIDRLNGFASFTDAEAFVASELSEKYNWDMESKPVRRLMDLVRRRYLKS